jgi:penicillin amidase
VNLLVGIGLLGCTGQIEDSGATGTGGGLVFEKLSGPVTLRIDDVGIGHITASTDEDGFWAQGYFTARDRFWLMDLQRRKAQGRLSEILGQEHLEGDILLRGLNWKRNAEEIAIELRTRDPELARIFTAYVAGVNQYLEDARAGRYGLSPSPQILALDYEPDPWTIADSFSIENLITGGLSMRPGQDLMLGLVHTTFGQAFYEDLYRYQGMDTTSIVPDFYGDDEAARKNTRVTTGNGGERIRERMAILDDEDRKRLAEGARKLRLTNSGSNNFVVDGDHSESGYALAAGDTHFDTEHPTVLYYLHMDTTGGDGTLNAIGATFPGLPLILFGHNGRIAWLPTTGFQDASDAYLEAVVPGATNSEGEEDPARVAFQGDLVELEKHTEVFYVREPGADPDTTTSTSVDLYTVPHHGPLIPNEGLGLPIELGISIRWTGFQARSIARPYLDLSRSTDWESFRSAIDGYYTGGIHWVYAGDDGQIGYTGYTDLPIREQLDRTAPPVTLLPGDGDYEWVDAEDGAVSPYQTVPRKDVPWVLNPERGWIVTANNDPAALVVDNDPLNDPVYFSGFYDTGNRAFQASRRIEEILAERKLTFEDARDIQLDTLSRAAENLLPWLFEAAEARPDLVDARQQQALDLLTTWNLHCDRDLVAPTLAHAWMAILVRDTLSDVEGGLFAEIVLNDLGYGAGQLMLKMIGYWLEATGDDIAAIDAGEMPFPSASGTNFFDDERTEVVETRDELLLSSLDNSLDSLSRMLGDLGADPDDMTTWTWGVAHTLTLEDPAAVVLPEASSETVGMSGGLYTVQIGDFDLLEDGDLPERFDALNISSNRFLIEMVPGAVRAEAILPGGQAEQPGSPFHNDQLQEYIDGAYRPLRYYPDEIEEGLVETWSVPAGFPIRGEITVE